MIKQVHQYKISQIFEIGSKTTYEIPKYQREYTWSAKEWSLIFNDIISNKDGYFLGSYICVSMGAMGNSKLELIDGQQRFTTISILLAAIYSKLNEHKSKLDEEEISDLINIKNELTCNIEKGKYIPKLKLQKQNSNSNDYLSLFYEKGLTSEYIEKPNNAGNRKIYKAFRYFEKSINDYIQENKNENNSEIEILIELKDKFNEAIMVGIEVDSHTDAYMLFESLNNRGIPLSAVDLIKNTLIAISEIENKSDESYEIWKTALGYLTDDYGVQERFLRQYYNAFREKLNEPFSEENSSKKYALAPLATRSNILDIYEQLIKKDFKDFLEKLLTEAKIYSIIINNSDEEKIYKEKLLDLERIQGVPAYLLLLYVLTEQERLILTDEDINFLVDTLIKFFVRRNITDIPNTRNLTRIFMDIIDEIKVKQGKEICEYVKDKLKSLSASDEIFENKLRGPIYEENNEATRFILCSIEKENQNKEIYTDLWKRDEHKKYIWTIEHIFPEGDKIPEHWVEMIADGDRQKANEYRNQYVHTIGNLTITGYNSNLSNMSFTDKRDRKNKEGKDIGYKNGLHLNKDVVNQSTWTIPKIQERTDNLIKILMELFSL